MNRICSAVIFLAFFTSTVLADFRRDSDLFDSFRFAGNEPSPMFRSRRSGSDDLDDLESEADSVVPIVRRMRSRTLPLQMLAQPPIGFGQVRNYEDYRIRPRVTSSEFMSILDSLSSSLDGPRQRFRFAPQLK